MSNLINQIKSKLFEKKQPLQPGLYGFQTDSDNENQYRMHLRIEEDGCGLLILNASTVLHLNQTGTEFAYHLIKQSPKEVILKSMMNRYQANYRDLANDYDDFQIKIKTLLETPDLDPVTYLDFERHTPNAEFPFAPYRLDCAITYKTNSATPGNYAPVERVQNELSTQEWKTILTKAWNIGIPHVVFTGGEPTLRDDLMEIITAAENLGMVTGLYTDGILLSNKDYLGRLLLTGLDHILLSYDFNNNEILDVIKLVLDEDIHLTIHVNVDQFNYNDIFATLDQLKEIGVENISLSASDAKLDDQLIHLSEYAAHLDLNLQWDVSVPYSQNNPVSIQVENESNYTNGAGSAWLYLEPDGDVLPSQGIPLKFGNFLEDDWKILQTRSKEYFLKNLNG